MAGISVERYFQLSLLGLLTSGYLAVAGSGFLDAPTLVLTALGLAWRLLLTLGRTRATIPDRWVTALTLAYTGFFPLDWVYLSHGFIEATIHLIFFLAVLKIVTARTGRDYLYAAVIAFLELLAAALISVNLNFFVFLVLYLAFAVAAFTSGEIRRSTTRDQRVARPGVRWFHPRLAGLAVCITLGILVLTAGLFFLLPRTAEAALGRLIAHRYFLPGFSNQVTLGQIGEIKTNSRAVMHVKVYTPNTPENLKWRGAALTRFDGKIWSNPPRAAQYLKVEHGQVTVAGAVQRNRAGRRVAYRVDLNAIDTDRLFFAGAPEVINIGYPRLIHGPDGGFRVDFLPAETIRYEGYGNLDESAGDILTAAERVALTDLPALDGRIAPRAREWAGEGPADVRARRIEGRLQSEYAYTLELPKKFEKDPLAHFLFERKKGHCEYFASAMTVMLRTAGIPARMVTGFQSGTFNPISELYVVRASDAHTWVEAWVDGHGWMTFDPTPPDPNPRPATLLSSLALYLDAADSFWQQWVVAYDLTRQITIVERLERAGSRMPAGWPDWRVKARLTHWLNAYGMAALGLFAVSLAVWFAGPVVWRRMRIRRTVRMFRQGQAGAPDATVLYERMLEILQERRFEKPAWFTAQEFARSIADPELGPLVTRFTESYHALRFGGRSEGAETLNALLEELEAVRSRDGRRGRKHDTITRMMRNCIVFFVLLAGAVAWTVGRPADIPFEKHTLDLGANETAAVADINGDGKPDIISGENWYEAPRWTKHKFRNLPFSNNYIDDFSDLPLDVNGDGNIDIVSCAWFAKRLWWSENPGKKGGAWKEHDIETGSSIEFAFLVDLDNDGKAREVLPQFGPANAPLAWYEVKGGTFVKHVVNQKTMGHGIGVGDVNGDGRNDIITPKGWFEAPADPRTGEWKLHAEFDLGSTGFIHVMDVNGDGKPDLVTSMAHDYGIFWMEQGAGGKWTKHMIDESWSQAHALTLVDLKGDGKKQIVTGKRFMAHNGKDPGEREPLGIYWYEPITVSGKVEWARHLIDYGTRTGGGMQIPVADVDGDGDKDIVVAGKGGLFLFENLTRRRTRVAAH